MVPLLIYNVKEFVFQIKFFICVRELLSQSLIKLVVNSQIMCLL